jgi:hypothetical protein
MKKQTTIDWLADRLESITLDLFEQAKQMEREQIIEAAKYGNSFEQGDLRCEVYYNETYGQKKT